MLDALSNREERQFCRALTAGFDRGHAGGNGNTEARR